MAKRKVSDGIILGAVAGLLATAPQISNFLAPLLGKIIPSQALFLDSFSIPFWGLVVGAGIGWFVDRT